MGLRKFRSPYDCSSYDPENKHGYPGQVILNTWQGFAVQPAKGSWRRIRWHLFHVICGGDKRVFKYQMRWLAHCVQHPGSPGEVMVVLKSDFEGAGKSTLGKIMVRIFGRHGFEAASLDRVFGDFNDQFATLSFVLLEEAAFPGDHKRTNAVKATITGGDLTINPKGRPAYATPNTLHFMLCTNEAWAVQAGKDARRFFVLDVTMKKDRGYFDALYAEIDAGGTAAFLDALLHVNLAAFNPRNVPVTQALVEQQRRSAGGLYHWIVESVLRGELIRDAVDGGFGQTFPAGRLHDHYRSWALAQGERHPMALITFGKELGKLGFTPRHSNGTKWTVPDAKALFTAAEKHAGIHRVGK
jgi:phage/plasmid-associated DNA primase